MSLIADSLKKALKNKETPGTTLPAFNLLRHRDVFKSPKAASLKKYLLPGIALSMSVVYLLYSGALNKFSATLSHLPISKALSIFKTKKAPLPPPQAVIPAKPVATPPPPAVTPARETVEPFVPPLEPAEPIRQAVIEEPAVSPPAREEAPPPLKVTIKRSPGKMVAQKPVSKKVAPPKTFAKPEKEKQHVVLLTPPPRPREVEFPETPIPEIFQDSNYYFNLGIFHHQAGEMEEALIQYNKAAELDPTNPEIYNNLGLIYKEQKFYDAAIEQFMRALFIEPNFAKAYNNIGVVYFNKGNIKRAIANYQKAVQINPKNLETYNNLGVIYKNQNQLEKAESVFNKAYSLNAKHPGTNYNLALLYEEMDRKTSAIFFYRRFVELGADTHPVLVSKVKAHLKSLGASIG